MWQRENVLCFGTIGCWPGFKGLGRGRPDVNRCCANDVTSAKNGLDAILIIS